MEERAGQDAERPEGPFRIIIDTDPALGVPNADIDDGLAIALALTSPEISVEGITIVNGNSKLETGVQCALYLLERLGREDVGVYAGADRPLVKNVDDVHELYAPHLGSARVELPHTTRTPERLHAANYIVETVMANPGEITVVAIGPMTNVALALALEPRIAQAAREFVLMVGSATNYAHNVTTVGDFNAFVDPEALQRVLDSGAKIRTVGIDQTSRVRMTCDHVRTLRANGSAFATWVADCAEQWIDFLHQAWPNRPEHADGCFLHDPLTVAALLGREILTWEPARVDVECAAGLARGLVVVDRSLALAPAPPANAEVAVDTDVDAFTTLFMQRLLAAEQPSVR
jgi:purine nucleosidase